METFMKSQCNRGMPVGEFDAMPWLSMVKRVTVETDGRRKFMFANDMKIKSCEESIVRKPYAPDL